MDAQYTATIYLIAFALFIMVWIVHNNDILDEKKKQEFISIFVIIMISAASEWFGNFLNGRENYWRIVHILVRAVEHSTAPAISIVFMNILSTKKKARILLVPLVLHAILEFASGYWGFIYYVDENNKYYHGTCYWIYITVYLCCAIYLLIEAARFSQKYQSTNRVILEMVFLFLLTGIGFRLLNSNIHVDYLCVAVDAIILYIYYTEIVEKTDSITNLLNRRSYESYLQRMHRSAVILYFDVDDFKHINDQYGHHVGDFCLKTVGKCVRQVYGQNGHCYRIGGDEFCVLLEKKMGQVELLNRNFQEKIVKLREKDQRIPYVSIGYVFFDPDKTDVESAVRAADAQMYRIKEQNKKMRKKEQVSCKKTG